jgi:CubicO group peptidase (beta-lactamase class C family)
MLLSHTSSIREGNYNVPYNHHISEYFNESSEIYYEGCYSKEHEPGYYQYVNMNYCLLGTIIERVSNVRFDLYMIENVLKPMGITGSFNIFELPKEQLDETGSLYEKLTDGKFDVNGKFTVRMDDFTEGYPTANYSEYVIGTNGALYGPMGSLRISLEELTHLAHMFINNGTYNGKVILKPETIEKMFTIIWRYDENKKNGETDDGYDYAYAGGPSIITNIGKNRLHEKKNLRFSGHTANAYGLFGGVFFDRTKGCGLVYRGNGVSRSLDEYVGSFSPYNQWALDFIKLADDVAQFDYPENKKEDEHVEPPPEDDSFPIYIIIIIAFFGLAIIVSFIVILILKRKQYFESQDTDDKKEQISEE